MISLIVPCYNEQESIPFFYAEATRVMAEIGRPYEILFVDDGSKDATLNVMKKIADEDQRVKYLSFSRNFGKEAAMYAGFCNVQGEYVAVMDADLQDPPALLKDMLELIEKEGYDSVATRVVSSRGGSTRLSTPSPIQTWWTGPEISG